MVCAVVVDMVARAGDAKRGDKVYDGSELKWMNAFLCLGAELMPCCVPERFG